jgi:hypothetical protein
MNLAELVSSLKNLDEITLIEVLDVRSEQIVDQFKEFIVENYDRLKYKVEEPWQTAEDLDRRQELTGRLSWKTQDTTASDFDDFDN